MPGVKILEMKKFAKRCTDVVECSRNLFVVVSCEVFGPSSTASEMVFRWCFQTWFSYPIHGDMIQVDDCALFFSFLG